MENRFFFVINNNRTFIYSTLRKENFTMAEFQTFYTPFNYIKSCITNFNDGGL